MAGGTVLAVDGLDILVDELRRSGYRVLGPTLRDDVVVLAELEHASDLPRGVGDSQEPGQYRTRARTDDALFGYAASPQAAKRALFPPDELLWLGRRQADGYLVQPPAPSPAPIALLGVRACDVAAVRIHDRILLGRSTQDTHYAQRRRGALLVAVTCTDPGGTCFCASTGTGPKPGDGADLVVTELLDGEHRLVVEAGSERGEEILAGLPGRPTEPADVQAVGEVVQRSRERMGRRLATDGLRDLLYDSAESPRWAEVGMRCLACTNCTAVCPTCFCTSVEDVGDLTGDVDERHRVWDSCFSMEYSGLHGGAVRSSTAARYRQWLTHKLAAWSDQFGTLGCVGCGRCITWCPAAIDLTAEVAALQDDHARAPR